LRDVLAATRQQALEHGQEQGRRAVLRVMRAAEADLARRLAQREGLKGKRDQTFTSEQMRVTLAQIRDVTRETIAGLKEAVTGQAEPTSAAAADAQLGYMRAAERRFRGVNQVLPVDDAMMLDAATRGAKASVLRRLATNGGARGQGVLQRYGVATVGEFERQLQVGLATRKPWGEVRDAVVEASPFLQGQPRYWAERLVRTELHAASNAAAMRTHQEAQRQLGDVVRILSATFDDRTSWDSYNVHGEVRRTAEPFEYVAYDGTHEEFLHPPNRPNDRELVLVHRLAWPIPPELKPRPTSEVEARCKENGPKAFPGRPDVMSTVARGRFAAE
jgi:hypothetical protein